MSESKSETECTFIEAENEEDEINRIIARADEGWELVTVCHSLWRDGYLLFWKRTPIKQD